MCDILLPLKFFQDLGTRSLASSGPYLRGVARGVHHRTMLTTIFGQKRKHDGVQAIRPVATRREMLPDTVFFSQNLKRGASRTTRTKGVYLMRKHVGWSKLELAWKF